MLNRLILKVIKFQLRPPKRLGTVIKNILGGMPPPPCQIGLRQNSNFTLQVMTYDRLAGTKCVVGGKSHHCKPKIEKTNI